MTKKLALLASASLVAVTATGLATEASAATAKHRAKAAQSSDRAEIEALRAQVEALTARLDAQAASQAQTQTQVQQAQAAATQAQTQAAAAATQSEQAQVAAATVPAQVQTAVAALPKPKPGWWENTSISGRMYFNFSNIDASSNGADTSNKGTGFNIKRFYVGVDHTFNDVFSGNVTMDISNVIGQTANANFAAPSANITTGAISNASLVGKGFYVKKAYLQAKLNPAFIIRLGSADLPWVPYAEGQYGYRHIENTLIDRISFGTSADWGIHVLGDLAGGLLSYQVSVIDGGGYRNVKVTKSVDVEGRVSAQYKGVYAAAGGYTGKLGNNVQDTPDPHTARRLDAMVGYKNKMFNVGGEYFWAKNYTNNGVNYITSSTLTDKGEGYSAFANVNFASKWSVFGRYDWVKPQKDNSDLKDHYYNVGLQWEPVKIVDLALVYKRDRAVNGVISTQNGSIGGVNLPGFLTGGRGTYNEIGLFGQLRF